MPALDRRILIHGLPVAGAGRVPQLPPRVLWGELLSIGFEDIAYDEGGQALTGEVKVRVRYLDALLQTNFFNLQVEVDGVLYNVIRLAEEPSLGRRKFLEILGLRADDQTPVKPSAGRPEEQEPLLNQHVVTKKEAEVTPGLKEGETPLDIYKVQQYTLYLARRAYEGGRSGGKGSREARQACIRDATDEQLARVLFLDPWFNPRGAGAVPSGPYADAGYFDEVRPYGPLFIEGFGQQPYRAKPVRYRYFCDAPVIKSINRPWRNYISVHRIEFTPIDEEKYPVSGYVVQFRRFGHPFDGWAWMQLDRRDVSARGIHDAQDAGEWDSTGDNHSPLTEEGTRVIYRGSTATFIRRLPGDFVTPETPLEFRVAAYVGALGEIPVGPESAGIYGPWSEPTVEEVRPRDTRSEIRFPKVSGIKLTRNEGDSPSSVLQLAPIFTLTWDKEFPTDAEGGSLDGYDWEIVPVYQDWPEGRGEYEGNAAMPATASVSWQLRGGRYLPRGTTATQIAGTPYAARVRPFRNYDTGTVILKRVGPWSEFVRDR